MLSLGNWIPTLLSEYWADATTTQLSWGGVLVMLISGLGRITGGFLLLRFSSAIIANGSILILTFLFAGLFALPFPGLLLVSALMAALSLAALLRGRGILKGDYSDDTL
jgi:hypothetical protein